MVKRLVTALALTVALSVPSQVLSKGNWDNLTLIQREVLVYVAASTQHTDEAYEYWYDYGMTIAAEVDLEFTMKQLDIYADCLAEELVAYFQDVRPSWVANSTDQEIIDEIADNTFIYGAACATVAYDPMNYRRDT